MAPPGLLGRLTLGAGSGHQAPSGNGPDFGYDAYRLAVHRIRFNTCPGIDDGWIYPYSVLVHEAGHALLGLGHPDRDYFTDSMMNYITSEPDCSPHPFDVLAIYALYQKATR